MAIVLRPARTTDAEAIIDLGIESVCHDPLPVVIDRKAMRETFAAVAGRANHFCWVAEKDGAVVAGVVAVSQPAFWFRGQQVSVLLFYSRSKGAGLPLLRKLAEWVKGRPAIKLAIVELEPGVDPRIASAFKRLGFKRESTNLCFVRGQQ